MARAAVPVRHRTARPSVRPFDVVVALVSLIVLLAPALVVATLIMCRLGRPVLFRQQRLGLHGKKFSIVKFRTMCPARYPGQPDHERITRLGSILRASSIDELPQLINVLRGQMSIIGPRPGLPEHLPRYSPQQRRRLTVRPGITGWAQVNGRNSVSLPKRIELDLWYVEHRCWRVDLKILFATIGHLTRPHDVVGPGGVNPEFPPEPAGPTPAN
jgi:lipopolysaccharide/colanic/teichoic acid biosynthesis glycosyltransferase